MSIEAIGSEVERHKDGSVTVRASIRDSESTRFDSIRVTGATLEACKLALQEEVDKRAKEAGDSALRAAVIGRVLASSQSEA